MAGASGQALVVYASRRMSYSERRGIKPARSIVQKDAMDTALRNALWDAFHLLIWGKVDYSGLERYFKNSNLHSMFQRYWHLHRKEPMDRMPDRLDDAIEAMRKEFFQVEW